MNGGSIDGGDIDDGGSIDGGNIDDGGSMDCCSVRRRFASAS